MADIISKRARSLEPSVTLSLTAKAKELKAKGENVVGLTAGEPDFDTPEVIKQGAIEAIKRGETKYTPAEGIAPPAEGGRRILLEEARSAVYERRGRHLARRETLDIQRALRAHGPGRRGAHSLAVLDELSRYGQDSRRETPDRRAREEDRVQAHPRDLQEAALAQEETKVLLFNSPSNPASLVYRREEIEAIAKIVLESGIALISDEIYEFLTFSGWEHYSPVTVLPQIKDQTVVVTGVSKSYAMTGWRVGFALAEKDIAYRMAAFQAHATGCPNSVSQWAALAAIEQGAEDREMMRVEFEKRKNLFGKRLSRIPSIWYPEPGGAFYYLVDVSKLYKKLNVKTSFGFCDKLLAEQGLVVIPGGAFGCDKMIRFSFAASENDINRALDRFENFVRKYAS